MPQGNWGILSPPNPKSWQKLSKKNGIKLLGYIFMSEHAKSDDFKRLSVQTQILSFLWKKCLYYKSKETAERLKTTSHFYGKVGRFSNTITPRTDFIEEMMPLCQRKIMSTPKIFGPKCMGCTLKLLLKCFFFGMFFHTKIILFIFCLCFAGQAPDTTQGCSTLLWSY